MRGACCLPACAPLGAARPRLRAHSLLRAGDAQRRCACVCRLAWALSRPLTPSPRPRLAPRAEHVALDKIVASVLGMYKAEAIGNFRPALLAMSRLHSVDDHMRRNTIRVCKGEIRNDLGTLNKRALRFNAQRAPVCPRARSVSAVLSLSVVCTRYLCPFPTCTIFARCLCVLSTRCLHTLALTPILRRIARRTGRTPQSSPGLTPATV